MKLLTFLGVARYQETTYCWREQEHTSRFAPAASCAFLQPNHLIVFVTEDAHREIFPQLKAEVDEKVESQAIPIPLGSDEQELWQIFGKVSGCVQPSEEVAFDITHGLRSFPLIGLLAAAFLRSGVDVKLRALLYGAFDVGKMVSPGRTPMFDLTPMLTLLEWSSASDRFNRTGDSRYLASLIRDQNEWLVASAHGDPELLEQVGRLRNLAGALTGISQSLQLIRPMMVMENTAGLSPRIEKARPAIARATAAQPFSLILKRIEKTYSPLALEEPLLPEQRADFLHKQRQLILWYAQREQWVQAVTLAREWLVNWFMTHLNLPDLIHKEDRDQVVSVINSEANKLQNTRVNKQVFAPIFLARVPAAEQALDIWNILVDVRNDIDHAGMRQQPLKPEDLIKQIKKIIPLLQKLPVEVNYDPDFPGR